MNTAKNIFENISVQAEAHLTVIVLTAKREYIPMAHFESVLMQVEEFLKINRVDKLIFDGQKLRTFHQSIMTWYYLTWKPRVLKYGLNTYRELLPKSDLIRKSVEIGKKRILRENPHFDFERFDIKYCESLEEALED